MCSGVCQRVSVQKSLVIEEREGRGREGWEKINLFKVPPTIYLSH